jgi:hypothetical protein
MGANADQLIGNEDPQGEKKNKLEQVKSPPTESRFFSAEARKSPDIPRLKSLLETIDFSPSQFILVVLEETGVLDKSLEQIAEQRQIIGRIALLPYDGGNDIRSAALEAELAPFQVHEASIQKAANTYKEAYKPDAKGRVTNVVELNENVYEPTDEYNDSALLTTFRALQSENFRSSHWEQRMKEAERIARIAIIEEISSEN